MPSIDLSQGQIHYHVAGPDQSDAPPVVFVHGFMVDHGLWTGVADRLAAQGIRSYAPDWPLGSHTTAMKPDADMSPRGVARLINDFLAALDLDDVTLVGNDTGGAICQFLIDTDHSRIGRLVLTNCDAFDKFPPFPFNVLFKLGRSPSMLKVMAESMRSRALRHSWIAFGGLVSKPLDPDLSRRWITAALDDAGVRRDTARLVSNVRPKELEDVGTRLGGFGKPVHIVWGAADTFFTLEYARRLRDAFGANAELVEVPGGRTFLSLDEPDRVAEEIRGVSYARN
jgi:pimeloyl-ACP methyl ester carboxylesterase